MALRWELTRIGQWETTCFMYDEVRCQRTMNAVTNALITACMFVGMNEITSENAEQFAIRLLEYERVTGDGLLYVHSQQKERMPNWQEVQSHIGLSTNASKMSNAKWRGHLTTLLRDNATRALITMKKRMP